MINKLLNTLECPTCQESNGIQFNTCDSKRHGFAFYLTLICQKCDTIFSEGYTRCNSESPHNPKPFTVNDMLVLFFNQIGIGYSGMQTLGSILGCKVLNLKTFQQKEAKVSRAVCESTEAILHRSVDVVRAMNRVISDSEDIDLIDVGVSFDGSWHTRGHRSKYGIAAVIEVITGHVLDYEILCSYCQNCSAKEKYLATKNLKSFRTGIKTINLFVQ